MNSDVMTNTKRTASRINVKTIAQIGMLGAIATVLMLFEVPLPFAPSFYQLDFSEVPVMVGCFAMGPLAGAAVELIKILLNLIIHGTITGGVGEAANFIVGCALCVPAGIIYRKLRSKKGALAGMALGTVLMTIVGCLVNAYVLLPLYSKLMELPIPALVEMGTKVNPAITNLNTLVIFAVAPFNILKGTVVSVIVLMIYKKISPIFKISRS